MDIRRKRHGARAGHDILEYAVDKNSNDAFARFGAVFHDERKFLGNEKFDACFGFFPGLTSTSQCVRSRRFNKRISTLPPFFVKAKRRAGKTFVLLTTSTSPARRYSVISRNILCSVVFVALS